MWVTDASLDSTLDFVSCLGKRGIDVYAMGGLSKGGLDFSFHSRHRKEGIIGADPKTNEYVEFLAQNLRNDRSHLEDEKV
jgi:hypothetical protein